MSNPEIDYKNVNLTDEERKEGWRIAYCSGNTHKRGCGKGYRTINWHTPSGCPHCSASFVD